jgi:YbbR domain-containing protein
MKRMLLNNLGLKVLSLLFAIIIWFFISAKGGVERTLDVPIEYINIPPGHEILKKHTEAVKVSIFGSERVLRTIKPEDLKLYIDLRDALPGKFSYSIKKGDISVPQSLSVFNITPKTITVTIIESKNLEIRSSDPVGEDEK